VAAVSSVAALQIGTARSAAAQTPPAAASVPSAPFVAELSIDGAIGPATVEYFTDAVSRATASGADAVLLRLDTPGGLSESMRRIVSAILASRIPVLCYVAPDGARAASAGTYILYACHVAAMAPATHLGAATPVSLSGGTPMPRRAAQASTDSAAVSTAGAGVAATSPKAAGDAESNKVLNDAIAYIRSLAQLRGRNANWGEQAVRGAATLTADEAVQQNVVDFVATDATDLLRQASGREVRIGDSNVTLALQNQPVRAYAPNWRSNFLATITNPTVAYLLLLAGIFGLIVEVFHPGAMLPGIAGVICLLIGMYALQMLPVNYTGLALMTLGVGLLIAEMVSPSFGVMGVGGVISFVLGSVMLMNSNVPGYTVNLGVIAGISFAGIVVLGMILWLVMRARRARQGIGDAQMIGAAGELLEPTDAKGEGWAQINGERWQVVAGAPLPARTNVRVVRRDGLVLWVIPERTSL
jgi:membrane-bound serine protease (ClpP class)